MNNTRNKLENELTARAGNGMLALFLNIALIAAWIIALVFGIIAASEERYGVGVTMIVSAGVVGFVASPILLSGLKVVKPNEALVLTLFGKYIGVVKGPGFYYVNPFASTVLPPNPMALTTGNVATGMSGNVSAATTEQTGSNVPQRKRFSLKAMTLSSDRQKINDLLGNPIEIGVIVI